MRQSNTRTLYAPRALVCTDSFFSRPAARRRRGYAAAYSAAVAGVVLAAALLVVPRAKLAGRVRIDDARIPAGAFEFQNAEQISAEEHIIAPERVVEASHYVTVPFETVTVSSAELYRGETAVITDGRPGVRRVVTRSEFYEEGQRARETVSSELIIEPVAETIAVGTAVRPLTASYGEYIRPAAGAVTSWFGYRNDAVGSKNHKGIDIAGSAGDAIYAADGGEVILADDSLSGFGLLVQIRHDNGDVTYYGHNRKLLVEVGERVYRGQKIAEMGATGVASGVHCHFELHRDGKAVNPARYIDI